MFDSLGFHIIYNHCNECNQISGGFALIHITRAYEHKNLV
jgi:hypothetical protein